MKNLQNNFTTPEQSNRLLELDVPADSADFYYDKDEVEIDEITHPYILPFNRKFSNYNDMFYLPCWSVGRLIEINRICSTLPDEEWMFPFWKDQEDNIEWAILVMESGVIVGNMDFSKLEE